MSRPSRSGWDCAARSGLFACRWQDTSNLDARRWGSSMPRQRLDLDKPPCIAMLRVFDQHRDGTDLAAFIAVEQIEQ